MFKKLKKLVDKNRSLGALVGGLLLVTFLTAGAGILHHSYELAHQTPTQGKKSSEPAEKTASTSTTAAEQAVLGDTSAQMPGDSSSPKTKPTSRQSAPQASTPSSSSPSASAQNPATVSASLTINNVSKGTVVVAANSNHCEVLSQALKNGQISSLDMRYSSQYGTQAVYMIDGVGDSNAVWWTYKVNGNPPPYGCSQMTVKQGDSAHWQYVKR